jgi:hypothetical protein
MKTDDIVKIVLVILILVGGGYSYYRYLLNPKITEIKEIDAQILTKGVELETYYQVRKFKTQLVAQNAYYNDWISKINFVIPNKFTNSDNARFILNLSKLGTEAGVNISKIAILDPSISGNGAENTKNAPKRISKNVIGLNITMDTNNYANFKKFNDMMLNNFENIIIPESYTDTSTTNKDKNGSGTVIYSETMSGYLVLSPDAKMPEKPTKK